MRNGKVALADKYWYSQIQVSGRELTILLIAVLLLCRSWREKWIPAFAGMTVRNERWERQKCKPITADRKRMTAILARGLSCLIVGAGLAPARFTPYRLTFWATARVAPTAEKPGLYDLYYVSDETTHCCE